MARRPFAVGGVAASLIAVSLLAAPPGPPSAQAAGCRARGDEVRFDDGRLLVERDVRAVDPRNVREVWSACWRPTGRRAVLLDRRHRTGTDEASLAAVRRDRYVILTGSARIDAYDGRTGRLTATVAQRGAIREVVATARGRLAVLQDAGPRARTLSAGSGTVACVIDAGSPTGQGGAPFGELRVQGEVVRWHRDEVALSQDLSALSCVQADG